MLKLLEKSSNTLVPPNFQLSFYCTFWEISSTVFSYSFVESIFFFLLSCFKVRIALAPSLLLFSHHLRLFHGCASSFRSLRILVKCIHKGKKKFLLKFLHLCYISVSQFFFLFFNVCLLWFLSCETVFANS